MDREECKTCKCYYRHSEIEVEGEYKIFDHDNHQDCERFFFIELDENYNNCPCKLCIVKPMCTETCIKAYNLINAYWERVESWI